MNRVLRTVFGLEREAAARGWRKLLNEKLHNLPNAIRAIRTRGMR
jgi:hypothetical protein